MHPPIVEFNSVYFRYDEQYVLENINFKLEDKDFLMILGPNGGGKTTFIKLVLGLLSPTKGEIKIFGRKAGHTLLNIGYISQTLNLNLSLPITLEKMLELSAYPKQKTDRAVFSKNAKYWLDKVGLSHKSKTRFSELSGGQKQRALIARIMIRDPKLIVLDEPANNVDMQGKHQFCQLLSDIGVRTPTIIVTHDLDIVPNTINQIGCIEKQLVIHGSIDSLSELSTLKTHTDINLENHSCLVDYLSSMQKNSNFNVYQHLLNSK